jgi:hypothetical protein
MFSVIVEARIVFVTAIINLAFIALILLSCRCMNMWKLTAGLNKQPWYKKVFRWHCYLWYVFLPSLIIHAIFAIRLLGVPF